jgi:hypothetical protein
MTTHRRLPRLAVLPVLALGLLGATPALAEDTYYFCYLRDAYSDQGFWFTPIMSTSVDVDDTYTGFAYEEYASKSGHGVVAGSIQTGCLSSGNLDYVREQHSHYPEWYPGMRELEWPEPPVPSEPVEETPATDSLVVETPKEVGLSQAELAAMALAAERKHAADLAKAKAEHARLDAELEVKLRESLERARRRGRMQ